MRGLNIGRKWNGSRTQSFYCRMQNRVLEVGCPQATGPRECPLRQTCPAHSEMVREASNPVGVIQSP